MRRIAITERPRWKDLAERCGFHFHTIDNEVYWDERAYYAFTLNQIERDIEYPTGEVHAMAMDLAAEIVRDEVRLKKLCIPEHYWDWIAESWKESQPHLYGRFDLSYSGDGPAKVLELQYDTPTSVYEAAYFQWQWLEEQKSAGLIPQDADQYNSIHEKLVLAFAQIAKRIQKPFYFSAVRDSVEDQGTISYLRDCAVQAGVDAKIIAIEDIGLSVKSTFVDTNDIQIGTLFKLYPLEQMFEDEYGKYLPNSGLQIIEPAWKAVLSNKGILPMLWARYPNHPNLLPAFFEEDSSDLPSGWVRKPLYSREGANIQIHGNDGIQVASDGPYNDCPTIRQAYHPLPKFEGGHPLIGSWVIGDSAAGIGIREDAGLITQNTSRFLPHAIID
jgi:glutathionylspermidine synthase